MVSENWTAEQIELRNKRTKSPGFFVDPKKQPITTSTYELSPQGEQSISAKIYPNGEFGVGYVRKKSISAKDRRYDEDRRYAEENAEIVPTAEFDDSGEWLSYGRKIIPGVPPPKLGIGSDLSQGVKKYGLKGITSHGRKMLRNAGHLIDISVQRIRGFMPQMGTLTIPSLSPDKMLNICKNWNEIIRRFFQECRRRYARFGKVFDYASCTEIQPERWKTRSEVGLHLHFIFVAFRVAGKDWSLPDGWVRSVWRRTLVLYVGEEGVPNNLNYRRETVRESSAAYLAKYASKGSEFVKEVSRKLGEEYIPSRWWSINQRLRECIRKHTISSTKELAEKLLVISRWGESEYVKYIRCIVLKTNTNEHGKAHNCPEEIILGYGGLLTRSGFKLFSPGNQAESIRKYLSYTLDKPDSLVTS